MDMGAMGRRSLVTLIAGLAYTSPPLTAFTKSPHFSTINDYGGVGLLQTRTARFMKEGGASIGGSNVFPQRRFWGTFQPFSWLETTFRFTDNYNESRGTDRSFDAKFRLIKESQYWPQIAVGLQDLAGTGRFSSEYLVASRRVFDFDFTIGVAWGRLGSEETFRNPLTYISDRFETRSGGRSTGGTPGFDSYFSGHDVGLFGGIQYSSPINGLRIMIEYDGDAYLRDREDPRVKKRTPINFGAAYRPADWVDFSVGYERGDEIMVRGTLLANFNTAKPAPKFDRPPERVVPRKTLKELEPKKRAEPAAARPPSAPYAPDPLYHHASYTPGDNSREPDAGDIDVDRMFDVLAEYGYQIEDFHLDGNDIKIDVSPFGLVWRADTAALAARAVAASVTLPTGSIKLVVKTPQGGQFTTSVKLGPRNKPASQLAEFQKQDNHVAPTNSNKRPESQTVSRYGQKGPQWTLQPVALTKPLELDFDLRQRIAEGIIAGLGQAGFIVDGVSVDPQEVTVLMSNRKFFARAQGLGRAARVIANRLPESVNFITLVSLENGLEVSRVTLLRRDLEVAARLTQSVGEIWQSARIRGPNTNAPKPEFRPVGLYPDINFTIDPKTRQSVFDPEHPFLYQIYMSFGARAQLARRLSLSGEIGVNIHHNFDKSNRPAGSVLPHVRSDVLRYLQEGKNNLENLYLSYNDNLGPDWYGRISIGYFEQMYGGFSGELLHAPYGRRWAIGFDANQVWKRNYNQRLGFQQYNVLTGHISIYYEFPSPRVLATVRGGRYLARDLGATFELTRLFDSGVELGAFFSITDVPFSEFGEGSFDKGIYLSLPLDLLLTSNSRYVAPFILKPLFRDGGQMVNVPGRIYPAVSKYSLGSFDQEWNRFLD